MYHLKIVNCFTIFVLMLFRNHFNIFDNQWKQKSDNFCEHNLYFKKLTFFFDLKCQCWKCTKNPIQQIVNDTKNRDAAKFFAALQKLENFNLLKLCINNLGWISTKTLPKYFIFRKSILFPSIFVCNDQLQTLNWIEMTFISPHALQWNISKKKI